MKYKLYLPAFAALLLSACSSEEPVAVRSDEGAISFRTSFSRATETNLTKLQEDGFNATALWNEQIYFESVGFTYSGGTWGGNSVHFWPKGEDVSLKFYAYSPGSISDKMSVTEKNDYKMTDFAPNSSIAQQCDLVTAFNQGTKKEYEGQEIELKFKHRLSQVKIQAKRTVADKYKFQIKAVRIGNVFGKADFTFPADATSNTRDAWDNRSNVTSYSTEEYAPKELILKDNKAQIINLMGNEGSAMLIPQERGAWDPETPDNNGAYIAVLLRITHKEDENAGEIQIYPFENMKDDKGEVKQYAWAAVPVKVDWQPNKKYVYTLDFTYGAGYVDPTEPNDPDPNDPNPDPNPPAEPILKPISFKVSITPWDSNTINEDKDMYITEPEESNGNEDEE